MQKLIAYLMCSLAFCAITSVHAQSNCIGTQGQLRWFYWNNLDISYTIEGLYQHTYYPQAPDGMQVLSQPSSPERFNNHYGSSMRGYIMVPNTGTYTFNITGDDDAEFYLSTDNTPASKVRQAYFTFNTGDNHDVDPNQTSGAITLTGGQYYYFELNHVEGGGGDFVTLHWKTPSMPDTWQVVGSEFVYDYVCESLCSPLGTLCDDGDANTIDDQQDGFCNCFGVPRQTNNCVGTRGSVVVLYYDNIAGETVEVLDTAANYPDAPNDFGLLTSISRTRNRANRYAARMRAFLTVPMTGDYTFNVTGDDETILYWTGSDDPNAPLQMLAHAPRWTNVDEHDKYPEQTSATINLQKGQVYYIEMQFKEGTGGDHFGVWWRTPFYTDNSWRIIQGTYLYQYACETACLPAGTPCDDQNASTYDDLTGDNCDCAGTPCGFPNCDDAPTYQAYELCGNSDKHSNKMIDSWLSCSVSPNPNPAHSPSHWIMYDFNSTY
ncbi:MAG: PA14 domain-containing protein, partial [Bacteroidota bacterium]